MPNGDPRDRFFYPTLTLMMDSYSLQPSGVCDKGIHKPAQLHRLTEILKVCTLQSLYNTIIKPVLSAGFPQALEIMENLENH